MNPLQIQELPAQNSSLPLRLYLIKNLGSSSHTDCRQILRQKLFDLLTQEGHSPSIDLLDLEKRPAHPSLNISLSHGHHHSLLGWTEKSHHLGVDIEALDRLSLKIIDRVSSPVETARAPDALYLWSPKEAAFKALYPRFNVVSSVEIIDWKMYNSSRWTFGVDLKSSSVGYGELCLIERHSIAFFTLPT